MARYRFYGTGNKIICISTFAKKDVKGVAKCSPNDDFDFGVGRKLAKLRCDKKVAKKRLAKAKDRLAMEKILFDMAKKYYADAQIYFDKATHDYVEACQLLEDEENFLKAN